MWKEAVMIYFKELLQHEHTEIRENDKNPHSE
jgi:hypothetical protein